MLGGLPFPLDDLLHQRSIESDRLEFKATWDEHIAGAVVETACAFANDLLNLNGGYILLGVEEQAGQPVLPPRGLGGLDLDLVQKKIHGACARIEPAYQPQLFVEYVGAAPLLILWCPGGDNRPYQAPLKRGEAKAYFVRRGPLSCKAEGDTLRQLQELAAKIPFDDRRSLEARMEDLDPLLLRRFLHQVGSSLVDERAQGYELFRRLRFSVRVNGHEVPRNIGLLFFNEDPDQFFRGARIEVVQFNEDSEGDLLSEHTFKGPLPEQVRAALSHLSSLGGERVRKIAEFPGAERESPYPIDGVREALVNAVYHRGYDWPPEPVKVYVYADRMEITSYPGPMPGLQMKHLEPGAVLPPLLARNRRIADLFKELRLAEVRGTGIPKIRRLLRESGSPAPHFDFDEERSYFRTTLYVHPTFLRARAHDLRLRPDGQRKALDILRDAASRQPGRWDLSLDGINLSLAQGDLDGARALVRKHRAAVARGEGVGDDGGGEGEHLYLGTARALLDVDLREEALAILWVAARQARMHTGTHFIHGRLVWEAGDPAWAYDLLQEVAGMVGKSASWRPLYQALAQLSEELALGRPEDEQEQLRAEAMEWSALAKRVR